MKKIIKKITILLICILLYPSLGIYAQDEEIDVQEIRNNILNVSAIAEKIPEINSRSAVVIDRNSHKILYGKNENSPRAMASTTKIMTCIVALEKGNLQDEVIVTKKSAGTGGSRLGLKTNDKITLNDLLYGLMLCSRK